MHKNVAAAIQPVADGPGSAKPAAPEDEEVNECVAYAVELGAPETVVVCAAAAEDL